MIWSDNRLGNGTTGSEGGLEEMPAATSSIVALPSGVALRQIPPCRYRAGFWFDSRSLYYGMEKQCTDHEENDSEKEPIS